MDENKKSELMELTATIVSAYVSNHSIAQSDLTGLIRGIHQALGVARSGAEAKSAEPQVPAVTIRRSITPDFLICLEDGRKFKSLKRHLRTNHDLSPQGYRTKWGLAKDYPMAAANYSAARSALAKQIGLGQGGRGAALAKSTSSRPARKRSKAATAPAG